MKIVKLISHTAMFILLILNLYVLVQLKKFHLKEDLNGDGVVNSADLLYLKMYLLNQEENRK